METRSCVLISEKRKLVEFLEKVLELFGQMLLDRFYITVFLLESQSEPLTQVSLTK